MAARLADELLVLIFDQVAADREHLDTRRGAKEGLASACLASKRLRRLAQKVLWRQVEVRSAEQLDRVRRGAALSGLGGCVVVFRVTFARRGAPPFTVANAVRASSFLPNVERMEMSSRQDEALRLDLLEPFSSASLLSISLAVCSKR